jgi:hypothetical protein
MQTEMKYGGFNIMPKENAKRAMKSPTFPRPKMARMWKSQMKTMLITFFDIKDTVHFEFIQQGQTVNQIYNMEILKRLREAVPIKMPELWSNDWILHHDNAQAHKTLCVKQFIRLLKWDPPFPFP